MLAMLARRAGREHGGELKPWPRLKRERKSSPSTSAGQWCRWMAGLTKRLTSWGRIWRAIFFGLFPYYVRQLAKRL